MGLMRKCTPRFSLSGRKKVGRGEMIPGFNGRVGRGGVLLVPSDVMRLVRSEEEAAQPARDINTSPLPRTAWTAAGWAYPDPSLKLDVFLGVEVHQA
jgi:hypothetical protein